MGTTSTATGEDLGSAAQRDRRRRILEATIAIARRGGFDAVQMRAVAEQAEVALGTLYRYFPSKIHLLVSALSVQFEKNAGQLSRKVPGDTPAERVSFVLRQNARALQKDPHLTEALTRAFMFADASVADEIHAVGMQMSQLIASALHGEGYDADQELGADDIAIARVISDVWFGALMSWVTGRATADEVSDHVDTAIRLLLR